MEIALEFTNLDEFMQLLEKAKLDTKVLQADIEAIKNFKFNVSF